MTTNDAAAETPREAIAELLWRTAFGEPDESDGPIEQWLPEADAVIAHIWQAADDWDAVQLKVAVMLEGEVKCDVAPDSYHAKLEEMTSEIVTTLLTALIGPRPQGGYR